ncbi:MAG: hypothetical protein CV045_02915 [Cyanobacteria bacterium M5B4]|nr:MAG: hypothetical protein CV045_02915 [Cyanobacteria bacterium M5B4]
MRYHLISENRTLSLEELIIYLRDKYKLVGEITTENIEKICSLLSLEIKPVTSEEYSIKPLTWDDIRRQRDKLLEASDWKLLICSNTEQWVAYKHLLRVIPEVFENPEDVVFPKEPPTLIMRTLEVLLDNEEVEKIKNKMTLEELELWSQLKFSRLKSVVNSILTLCEKHETPITTILEE